MKNKILFCDAKPGFVSFLDLPLISLKTGS